VAVVESGSGAAASVASITFPVSIQEFLVAGDVVSAAPIFNAIIAEQGIASDSTLGRFLWELINSTQNPNWAAVSSDTNAGWSQITGEAPTNWVKISTVD